MPFPGQFRFLAVAFVGLWATALPAQHYQGHDHHLYHAPAAVKQQEPHTVAVRARATVPVASARLTPAPSATRQTTPAHPNLLPTVPGKAH